ncbi:hypothetical protein [uncultured Helicobacter sp.]|uniref:hypothetical protein n=1 Tax=uncultured Helicobacter sp. TaxID=175537 RepID=UPI00374E70AD
MNYAKLWLILWYFLTFYEAHYSSKPIIPLQKTHRESAPLLSSSLRRYSIFGGTMGYKIYLIMPQCIVLQPTEVIQIKTLTHKIILI